LTICAPQSFGLANDRQEQTPTPLGKVGVQVADLTPETAKQFGFDAKTQGAVVTDVQPGSAASAAGLRSGMLILKADQQAVTSLADLQRILVVARSLTKRNRIDAAHATRQDRTQFGPAASSQSR
jgi:S1-C subfamily serine protease